MLPDLEGGLFRASQGRLILGQDLVLVWEEIAADEHTPPIAIEFSAREGDGTKLAVLAKVPLSMADAAVLAELIRGCAAMARKIYPTEARISFIEPG